jgi:uncharacterized RDD family membrane protein YckC
MPTTPPLAPAAQPMPAPPPPPTEDDSAPPSPWLEAPLAPITWRVGGLFLDGVLVVCTLLVGWLAWWIVSWDHGRSPSKSILHTRVVRADNRELPGFARMSLREVVGKGIPGGAGLIGLSMLGGGSAAARVLVAASLAWLAMCGVASLLDENRRTLWDAFAGTIVVLDPDITEPETAESESAQTETAEPQTAETETEAGPTATAVGDTSPT